MACNEECAFFTSDVYNSHNLWSCQNVRDALVYLLYNIFIRFGTKLYRQTIGIPMGTNCAPLVADLFLFCYERYFMKSLSRENQADIIEAFNSTSRYLADLLNIDNIYFDQMVDRIYPTELQLNRANSSDTEAPFLDLNVCIKKVRERSRECHNHKPQPFPDLKRKRKPTNLNKHKPNKRTILS